MPKAHRLKRRQDFSAVYQMGLRRNAAHLTLRALKLPPRQARAKDKDKETIIPEDERLLIASLPTCIGISISQKVSKRAVIRNRIKRQIRAALYQLLPDFHPGWYCVIVVRPGATQCDYQQFLQELKQLLTDAEVIDGY